MKVNVDLLLQLRKARAWSQDELATASGLNLRSIQRIEKEATASLQSMKALASAFDVNLRDLEHQESEMIHELLGKELAILPTCIGAIYSVRGKWMEIQPAWVKFMSKKGVFYMHMNQIVQIIPL